MFYSLKMVSKKRVVEVIEILKMEVRDFKNPIVTDIAVQTKDPFKVLISCLLSLRTKDSVTEKASERLFKIGETPEKLSNLSIEEIEKTIYPVGFYRTKARRIKEISRIIKEKYNSSVPDSMEELLRLKGVGRKTANIVMVYGFGKEGLPIDTHCHRIPNRLGWIKTKGPEETEKVLRKLIPKKYWFDFNDLFVQFGQNICKPVKPLCNKCPVKEYCRYYETLIVKNGKG
ncbi:MAG: endonuclease III domain-containing protein [Candidatus Aminicenantia bacterium]